MRFAVAASVVAQALPVASFETNARGSLAELVVDLKEKKKTTDGRRGRRNVVRDKTLSGGQGFEAVVEDIDSKPFKRTGGPLINKKFPKNKINKLSANHKQECDPTMVPASAEPDVGILGCGDHQYCMESQNSKLGGFCVMEDDRDAWDVVVDGPQRTLQSNNESASYTCYPPVAMGNGASYTCILEPFCVPPCNEVCSNDTYTVYESFDNLTRVIYDCYDVYEPYTTQLCYTYNYTAGVGATCSLSYAGQECASCYVIENCSAFDCSNVQGLYGQGLSGSTCYDNFTFPLPFFLNATYGCLEYCDICSGGILTNPNATIPFLDTSCLYADYVGSSSLLADYLCGPVQALAFDACGCEGGNRPFICTACPDDGMITNPDVEVNLTSFDLGIATCAEVQLYAPYVSAYYGLDMYSCPFFQAIVADPCGCQAPMTTPAPVEAMTPAPVEAMTPAPVEPMTPAPMTPMTPTAPAADPTAAPVIAPTEAPTSGGGADPYTTVTALSMTIAGVSAAVSTILLSMA